MNKLYLSIIKEDIEKTQTILDEYIKDIPKLFEEIKKYISMSQDNYSDLFINSVKCIILKLYETDQYDAINNLFMFFWNDNRFSKISIFLNTICSNLKKINLMREKILDIIKLIQPHLQIITNNINDINILLNIQNTITNHLLPIILALNDNSFGGCSFSTVLNLEPCTTNEMYIIQIIERLQNSIELLDIEFFQYFKLEVITYSTFIKLDYKDKIMYFTNIVLSLQSIFRSIINLIDKYIDYNINTLNLLITSNFIGNCFINIYTNWIKNNQPIRIDQLNEMGNNADIIDTEDMLNINNGNYDNDQYLLLDEQFDSNIQNEIESLIETIDIENNQPK